MNPEYWQRVKDVFYHALEIDPTSRASYLDHACKDDADLRQEIESLLASHQQADGFIEHSPFSRADSGTEAGASPVGRSLGAYRILRQIGHGGMGTVYLAERGDAQYLQQVAIKILKIGMDSDFLIARFRQERQILANLDHPSIARLLDGGTLEDGRPYLVMEYIEGEPIDHYCARRELSIRDRVKLFRKVCDAVQYAHRSLVIHRDLKPSNILVNGDGAPKLLDFGTAKLLAPSGLEPPATATGMRLMTPEFASPEQLRAEPVTTASDVYTLGVVLYRLLTGHPPYQIPSPLSPEAVRVVCEEAPPHLDTAAAGRDATTPVPWSLSPVPRATNERWRRHLTGDLDNIVLMALRKEPDRRYASVEQLSEDLRRYLGDLPVVARPDTVVYRAGKFARRHRAALLAAALVLLALTVGGGATIWQARRALAASERAEHHLRKAELAEARAEGVTSFLEDLFEVSDPGESKGQELTASMILDRGAKKIARELGDQPAVLAKLMGLIGRIYHKRGYEEQAAALLERALAACAAVEGDPSTLRIPILIHLGYVRRDQADYERARALFRQALELSTPDTDSAADALNALGTIYHKLGEFDKARETHANALAIRRDSQQPDERAIAASLNNLGSAHYHLDDLDHAKRFLREALAIRRRLDEVHPDVANSLNNLAAVFLAEESFAEAEELFDESLKMARQLQQGRDHQQVAATLDNLALARSELGRMGEARELHGEALEMRRRLFGERHTDVALSHLNLGVLHHRLDELEQAEAHYREALALFSEIKGPQSEDARACRLYLEQLLARKGDHLSRAPA